MFFQFAKTDQQAVNPGTATILRAGGLFDTATRYRHDLAFAMDPTILKNPHTIHQLITSPNALLRSVSRGLQAQGADFLASHGTIVLMPSPAGLFEVPVQGPLSEDLNYIP